MGARSGDGATACGSSPSPSALCSPSGCSSRFPSHSPWGECAMAQAHVVDLGHDRQMIDLGFRDTEGLVASYLLPGPDDGWTVVETGPSTCSERLVEGLGHAGVAPAEVS